MNYMTTRNLRQVSVPTEDETLMAELGKRVCGAILMETVFTSEHLASMWKTNENLAVLERGKVEQPELFNQALSSYRMDRDVNRWMRAQQPF
jgi:hypothetical protein